MHILFALCCILCVSASLNGLREYHNSPTLIHHTYRYILKKHLYLRIVYPQLAWRERRKVNFKEIFRSKRRSLFPDTKSFFPFLVNFLYTSSSLSISSFQGSLCQSHFRLIKVLSRIYTYINTQQSLLYILSCNLSPSKHISLVFMYPISLYLQLKY